MRSWESGHRCAYVSSVERSVRRWLKTGEAAQDALDEGEVLDEQSETCRLFWNAVMQVRSQVVVQMLELKFEAAQGGQLVRRRTLRNGIVGTPRLSA